MTLVKSSPKSGRSIDYSLTKIRLGIHGQGFECELSINLKLHYVQTFVSGKQNIVNRKDEVGLDIRFSGEREDSYADENLEEVVVVEQHVILIQDIFLNTNRLTI